MSNMVDVAIVGAGPDRLWLPAQLRAVGVQYRHVGMPMRLWQAAMLRGMFLKSQVAPPDGAVRQPEAHQVIAAAGYRADLTRLAFQPEAIRSRLCTVGWSPAIGRGYESSVAGVYFAGPTVAPSFGPVMRFVFGIGHAGPVVARRLAGPLPARSRSAAVAGG
jgi:hypothetical protein